MRNYAILLLVVCFVNCGFAINTEKLSRDDIEILYPEKVKDPNFTFNCNAGVKLYLIRDKDFTLKEKNSRLRKYSDTKVGYIGESSINSTLNEQNSLHTTTTMISIPSVITGEFILEPNNVYHATTDVTIQSGGTLRHMPGAVVKWAANTGLYVLPGGNYIARGTPGKMCINTADIDEPAPRYWTGIQIQGGNAYVSPSEITYTYISYADIGIFLLDVTLNRTFENNFLEYCHQGILAYGIRQTKIANNILCWNWVGIEAYHESITGSESSDSVIEIVNNTCYENDYGIDVHGSSESLVGITMIQANISAASTYYNYYLESGTQGGYFNLLISDNGRWLKYAGSYNTDFPAYLEDNPVEVFSNPFVEGSGYFDLVRLNQSCSFINAASVYISEFSQVGFTTSIDNTPDVNMLDLGFHYPNWNYSSTRACDFNMDSTVDTKDLAKLAEYWLFDYINARQTWLSDYDDSGTVDFGDLAEIAEYWLEPYNFQDFASFAVEWQKEVDSRFFDSSPDLNKDNVVNFRDYAILASEWQKTQNNYPPITVSFSDGQYGGKTVSVSGYGSNIYRIFLFIDGYYVNEIFIDPTQSYSNTEIFAPWLEAGCHEAKIIAFTSQGEVVCYPIQQLMMEEGITNCTVPSFFKQGSPIPFSVSSPLSDVRVTAMCNGEEVWSSTFPSGNYINGEVPLTVTQDYDLECLQFTPVSSGSKALMMSSSSSGSVTAPTVAEDEYNGYTALIICPYTSIWATACLPGRIAEDLERSGHKVKVMTFFAYHWRIKGYAQNENIDILCYIGHGGYDIGAIAGLGTSYYRSTVGLDGGNCISDKVSNYPPGSAPSWLQPLPPAIESTIKTWKEMDFSDLRFATFDCCYDGLLRIDSSNHLVKNDTMNYDWRSDMTEAFNLYYDNNYFFGWAHYWNSGCTSEYSKFSCNLWRTMGDGYSLQYALNYAIDEAEPESGNGDPRDEYRLYGQGYPDWFYLEEY